ncbi:hypothetical protein MMC30_005159 [Trapelia coarctata]|nr:hypothetical protein [Trapelia coarctata]
MYETRDSIKDIWGPRTPYKHEWPTRVDERITEQPDHWVQSACVVCSNGCGMDIGVKDDKIVGVRGRAVDRVNKGRLGPKGLHASGVNHHKDRLTHPLIRKNGQLERATWDEAMDLIVKKTKETQERLTNHGIAFYTTGQLFLEEYYALAMVGKGGLNTLHMDGNTRLCTATAAASMRESFGSDGQPGSYTDVDYTECLFIVGHNVSATQTVLWSRMLDRLEGHGAPKLIVVDPRVSETAKKATVHLSPKIGTNMAVLNGIQHLLFKNGWVNEDYVAKHVVGLDDLRKTVEMYTPEYVEKITDIPRAHLKEAAEIIGTTKSLLSTCLQGVYQSNQATASACQVNNINLLRGCIGKPGSGIFQMNGQPTAQNNRETGCDGEYPGFRNNSNPRHMQEIADIWNIDYDHIPHWNQPTHIMSLLNYVENNTIEMFWISGTNPLVSLPNLPRVRELLTKPNLFVICQDIFMTETASIADVILPAAMWGEKTGCFTNSADGVQGQGRDPLMPFTKSEEVFNAWKKMSSGRPCDYTELTYEKLTGGSGIQWPCNAQHPHGKERLFDDGVFFTDMEYCESFGHDLETGAPSTADQYRAMNPAGRAILKTAHYVPEQEAPNEEYPLRLSTGRQVYHFHTRTKTGRSKALQDACPEPYLEISEEDAAITGVEVGDDVVVTSRRGQVELVARVTQWDPVSKQPMFKSGAVKVQKCKNDAGEVKIHAKEGQTGAIDSVKHKKQNAHAIADSSPRERHLKQWLGATFESMNVLLEIYDRLIPQLTDDAEVNRGIVSVRRLTVRMVDALEPHVRKYTEDTKYGHKISTLMRDSLFPAERDVDSGYETLLVIQSLFMYLTHIEGHLLALTPASQALWDHGFIEAVAFCSEQVGRMQAWAKEQLKVKSPQTLLVPVKPLEKEL